MSKKPYKFKAKARDYGRDPETHGWTKLASKLESVGGWRLQHDLDQALEAARTDLGAACSHIERKDWPNAIVCIEDALKGATELRRILNSFREAAPVKPLHCGPLPHLRNLFAALPPTPHEHSGNLDPHYREPSQGLSRAKGRK